MKYFIIIWILIAIIYKLIQHFKAWLMGMPLWAYEMHGNVNLIEAVKDYRGNNYHNLSSWRNPRKCEPIKIEPILCCGDNLYDHIEGKSICHWCKKESNT